MPQSMGELEYETQSRHHRDNYPVKKKEKKWTLGSLFRRKKTKESDSETSDSDAVQDGKKRGFLARRRRRRSGNRGSKDVSQSFEHVDLRSGGGSLSSDGSRRSLKARVEANRDSLLKDSSSEDERSPRPRAPRSKRSSREIADGHVKLLELDSSPRSSRWTAKVVYCESSDYEARYTAHTRSATPSPAQSPVARVKHPKRPPVPQTNVSSRPLGCQKSASFDILPRQTRPNPEPRPRVPPPPPPRDPQRKIVPPSGYRPYERPLSYAFESGEPMPKAMTDYNSNITSYKTAHTDGPVLSVHRPVDHRVNSTSSLDHTSLRVNGSASSERPGTGSWDNRRTYHYYTDQQPRSRRPIHIARVDQPYLSDSQVGRIRTDDRQVPRDSNGSLYDSSDSRDGIERAELRPSLSVVAETNHQLPLRKPQEQKEVSPPTTEPQSTKRKSSNLEDALNELEAIYKSLQLRDEEAPSHRGFESDSGYNYRAVDDMAFRRLNRRDSGGSSDCRRVVSQAGSYLLVSPALSPPPFAIAPPIRTPVDEPDVTLDDVVYRNIRHSNNTLKINDPQPPFGIPLGPIAPAAGSDYLHASPKRLYRPTFKPRKTPDVVKDDLAYRNLRKDGQNDSLLSTEDFLFPSEPDPATVLKKKRAVRSLSANLLSIIQKERLPRDTQDHTNGFDSDVFTDRYQKTQSYTNLPDVLSSRYDRPVEDADATPRASRIYSDPPPNTTSTETLTDSRTDIVNSYGLPTSTYPQWRSSATADGSLPKIQTNRLHLRLPDSQRSSPPKKDHINLDDGLTSAVDSQRFGRSDNYSSQNNLLKTHRRTDSKSPSPYRSYAFDRSDGRESIENRDTNREENTMDRRAEMTRTTGPESRETIRSPSVAEKNFYQSLHKTNNYGLPVSDSDSLIKDADVQSSSSRNYSSGTISNTTTVAQKSPSPIVITSPKLPSPKNDDVDVPIVPPKPSPRSKFNISDENRMLPNESIDKNPSDDSVTQCTTPKTVTRRVGDASSPNDSGKRISIEGIKINMTPTSKAKSLKESNCFLNTVELKQQKISAPPTNTSKPKVPSPRTTVSHHEKSHLKNDTKISRCNRPVDQPSANAGIKPGKLAAVRPSSMINVVDASMNLEKTKNLSPNTVRLSVSSEKESKQKLPDTNLTWLSEEKNKSKSAGLHLPIVSSYNENILQKFPNSHTTLNSENSPVDVSADTFEEPQIVQLSIPSSSFNPVSTDKNACKVPVEVSVTSGLIRSTNSDRQVNKSKRKLKGKSLSLNSGLMIEDKNVVCDSRYRLTKTSSLSDSLSSDCPKTGFISTGNISNESCQQQAIEFEEGNGKSDKLNSSITYSSQTDNVSPERSFHTTAVCSNSSGSKKQNVNKETEKELNKLLTEINLKQDEILAGGNECKSYQDMSVCAQTSYQLKNSSDKRDSSGLMLGKITPHKPVILTTFSISEDDTIKNTETTIMQNESEDTIIGTSESMTDLLRELTRSLDEDFGRSANRSHADREVLEIMNQEKIKQSDSEKCWKRDESEWVPSRLKNDLDDDELTVDEADNEVMEINRKVLSEAERNRKSEREKTVPDMNVMEVKFKLPSGDVDIKTTFAVDPDHQRSSEDRDTRSVTESGDCNSDDSNTEFVEAICKTASEISALSGDVSATSITNASTSSGCTRRHRTNETSALSVQSPPSESSRWKLEASPSGLHRNEGILPSGLIPTNEGLLSKSLVLCSSTCLILLFLVLCLCDLVFVVKYNCLT